MALVEASGGASTVGLLIGSGLIVVGGLEILFWRSSAGAAIVKQSPLPPKYFDVIGGILILGGLVVVLGSLGGG